jgi:hypothetical protein
MLSAGINAVYETLFSTIIGYVYLAICCIL